MSTVAKSPAEAFLVLFPQTVQNFVSDGRSRSTAWMIPLPGNCEALLTDAEDDYEHSVQPNDATRKLCLGIFDVEGNPLDFEDEHALTWTEATRILQDVLEKGNPWVTVDEANAAAHDEAARQIDDLHSGRRK